MIVLLTDFGTADPYVGVMKGVILDRVPQCCIVDLTHGVTPFDVGEAAYFLGSAYRYFPHGTTFCCVVDPGVGSARRAVAVQTEHYRFVAPDNGLLSLVLQREKLLCAVELTNSAMWLGNVSATFHGRDIFAPVAALLALGASIDSLGEPLTSALVVAAETEPIASATGWRGMVVSVDHFGNLITNCTGEHLGTSDVTIQVAGKSIAALHRTFADVPHGEPVAYIGSNGYLEIALCNGNAAHAWGVQRGDNVIVETKKDRA